MDKREQSHFKAIERAIAGDRAAVLAMLRRHLMRYPRDILVHFGAMFSSGFASARRPLPRKQ